MSALERLADADVVGRRDAVRPSVTSLATGWSLIRLHIAPAVPSRLSENLGIGAVFDTGGWPSPNA